MFPWFKKIQILQDYLAGLVKLEFAWILSREKHLSEDLVGYSFW